MAYVPGCSADGFISYAHADNADKFVTRFKNFRQGSSWARADIWFDDRISAGAPLAAVERRSWSSVPTGARPSAYCDGAYGAH